MHLMSDSPQYLMICCFWTSPSILKTDLHSADLTSLWLSTNLHWLMAFCYSALQAVTTWNFKMDEIKHNRHFCLMKQRDRTGKPTILSEMSRLIHQVFKTLTHCILCAYKRICAEYRQTNWWCFFYIWNTVLKHQ